MTRFALALLLLTVGCPCWAEPIATRTEPVVPSPAAPVDASVAPSETPAAACAGQHEAAQVERMDGHLLEARQALLACASEQCPSVVRTDCMAWLEEVQKAIPTVVFEAVGDDGLLSDVEVELNGRVVQAKLDGKPVEMPVGLADLTFTRSSGEKKTLRILLRQGETNRIVSVDFRSAPRAPPASTPSAPAPPDLIETRPIPRSAWLLGTGTLIALATGATLGTVAKVKEGDAQGSCAPDCADGVVAEIKDFALAADISFGVAIAAGVTTAVLYVARPTVMVPRERARLVPRVLASPHGAWLGVEGRFQ